MTSTPMSVRTACFALAATFGAYGLILGLLTLHPLSNYDDVVLALAMSALCIKLARIDLGRVGATGETNSLLMICRRLPLAMRLAAALALVSMAVAFDRYLDGDPEHYRIATFIVPVVASVLMFDLRVAVFAIAFSALAVEYFLIAPMDGVEIANVASALDLVIYILAAGQIAVAVNRHIHSDGTVAVAGPSQAGA